MPSAPSSLRKRSGFTAMRVIPTPPPRWRQVGKGPGGPGGGGALGRAGEGGGQEAAATPPILAPPGTAPTAPPPSFPPTPPPPVTRRAPWKRGERSVRTTVAAVINFGGI